MPNPRPIGRIPKKFPGDSNLPLCSGELVFAAIPFSNPLLSRERSSPKEVSGGLQSAATILMTASLLLLTLTGCKDTKRAHANSDSASGNKDIAISEKAPRSSAATTASPNLPRDDKFHLISLDTFYHRLLEDYRPDESWAQVPRGETNFDGVPFILLGKIELTGLGRARDGEYKTPRVGEVPVGLRASKLHLLHGASYDAPDGTPIANLHLRYENGATRNLFLRYGVHSRNWYIERSERDATLADSRSLVIWNGFSHPSGGTPTRLFKTTFDNPLPAETLRGVEFRSLFNRPNAFIIALTVEDLPKNNSPLPPAAPDESDADYWREDNIIVLDADTKQPIATAICKLTVVEGSRTYRFGIHPADNRGMIRIAYPPGKFKRFVMEIIAPDYETSNIETSADDGLMQPNLPVPLKKLPPQ